MYTNNYNVITPEQIYNNATINAYITQGNDNLGALGFTEHGFPHVKRSSNIAKHILKALKYDDRTCELAAIAGYMHDIGNTVNRTDHAHSGALMSFQILSGLSVDPVEIGIICSAIGNHDEKTAYPVNEIAAALIIADKTDVRRSRVRDKSEENIKKDIHDRVNYAVIDSKLDVDNDTSVIRFSVTIDLSICSVLEYFEIFLERMILCRISSEKLNCNFELIINNSKLM